MTSDRDTTRLIGSWLHETTDALPDNEAFFEHWLDELPATPQRRSGWRLRRLLGSRTTPAQAPGLRGAAYQTAPITAADGYAPTAGGRTPSMFNAMKFVVAGAIVALFGGFVLAGLLTQPIDEPTPAAVSPSATADLLSTLDTEEIAPGVFQVLGDGSRGLDENVGHVAITPEGDIWVQDYGEGMAIQIVRVGEAGVAYRLDDSTGAKAFSRLVTGDDGTIGYAQGIYDVPVVLEGEEWIANEGSRYENCVRLFGSVAADRACFESEPRGTGLMRQEDAGVGKPVFAMEAGYEAGVHLTKPVSDEGVVWAAAYGDTDEIPPNWLEGLARYDDGSWVGIPYPGDRDRPFSGPLAVAPDGVVWIPSYLDEEGLTMISWDGAEWRSYGPLAVPRASADAHFGPDGTATFGVMATFDGTTLTRLGLPDGVVQHMGPLTFAPDGSAWAVKDSGLYVMTPEAFTAAKPVPASASAPPDATASPSARTSTDDLLAGMVTETVEPGVYRVINDGAGHDLTVDPWRLMDLDSIHATVDGNVWVNAFVWGPGTLDDELISLGVPGGHTSDDGYPGEGDLAVASDGTLWIRSLDRVASYAGGAWTVHRSDPDIDYRTRAMFEFSHGSPRLLVEADDTIWTGGWLGDVTDPQVYRLDAGGWTSFGPADGFDGYVSQLIGTPDGEVWSVTDAGYHRFDPATQTWERHDPGTGPVVTGALVLGRDGALRAIHANGMYRWDGQTWVKRAAWEELPIRPDTYLGIHWTVGHDDTVWLGGLSGLFSFEPEPGTWSRHEAVSSVAQIEVAPNGTIWVRRNERERLRTAENEGPLPSPPDALLAFDRTDWTTYGLPRTVTDFDIAPDGTVWAISNPDVTGTNTRDPYRINFNDEDWSHIYVITPQAVAAAE